MMNRVDKALFGTFGLFNDEVEGQERKESGAERTQGQEPSF